MKKIFMYLLLALLITLPLHAQDFLTQLDFTGNTLEENHISAMGSGFGQYPMAEISFGNIPTDNVFVEATDGKGLIVTAEPGEGVMIFTEAIQTTHCALLRCSVRLNAPHASLYLASVDEGENEYVSTITPNNPDSFVEKYNRIADFFLPPSTGFQGILQIVNTSETETLFAYVDNFEIIQLGKDRIELDVADLLSKEKPTEPTPTLTPSPTLQPTVTNTPTITANPNPVWNYISQVTDPGISGPSQFTDHDMVFDTKQNKLILFGGGNGMGSFYSSTWEWDGDMWINYDTDTPCPRSKHALVYDSKRNITLLFGGSTGPDVGDTWEWDGEEWTLLSTSGPEGRMGHSMAYDSIRDRVVLFGGGTYYGSLFRDTWEWDGSTWEKITDDGPEARIDHKMVFDAIRGKILLFGGRNENRLSDTWEWDGTEWRHIDTIGPSPRANHSMAYDSTQNRVILFGGDDPDKDDTWAWDGQTWTQLPCFGPDARSGHEIVYDTNRQRILLYGGIGKTEFMDIWELVIPEDYFPSPTPTITPTPVPPVYLTDEIENDVEDRIDGTSDSDFSGSESIIINWNDGDPLKTKTIRYHIYATINGASEEYLGKTFDGNFSYFKWTNDDTSIVESHRNGPQSGVYQFKVFAIHDESLLDSSEPAFRIVGESGILEFTVENVPTPTPSPGPSINPETGLEEIVVPLDLPEGAKPLVMVKIPAGTFTMGSPEDEQDRSSGDWLAHQVTISKDFYIGKYEITHAQWTEITTDAGYTQYESEANTPEEYISWQDAARFCNSLSLKEGRTPVYEEGGDWPADLNANGYRLPTEAQWEYACRAGTTTRFYWGDDPLLQEIDKYCWYRLDNDVDLIEVGQKLPNAFGLYDMSGGVLEWCHDRFESPFIRDGVIDPTGADTGKSRVKRSSKVGVYINVDFRSAFRATGSPTRSGVGDGFRLLRPVD